MQSQFTAPSLIFHIYSVPNEVCTSMGRDGGMKQVVVVHYNYIYKTVTAVTTEIEFWV